jgi:outer membrane protein TolC
VEVAERTVESAAENVRVSSDRYREGVIASSDRLDAETGLLRAGLERVRALTRQQLATAELERAVGR